MRGRAQSDLEKDALRISRHSDDYDEDDRLDSASSSRSVSSTRKLNRAFSTPRSRSSFLYVRSPAQIVRYACLALAAVMLFFMFSLVQMSRSSAKEVETAAAQKNDPDKNPIVKPPVWEGFEFLTRYYGGIRSLVPAASNVPEYPRAADEEDLDPEALQEEAAPEQHLTEKRQEGKVPDSKVFNPYPDYASPEYIAKHGEKVDCFLDKARTISVPQVRMYEGVPRGFPDAVMGSAELLGMRTDICYDRFGRLGPYGIGYSLSKGGSGSQLEGEREGADLVWQSTPEVDWRDVKWVAVQERCLAANAHRFKEPPKPKIDRWRAMPIGSISKRAEEPSDFKSSTPPDSKKPASEPLPRTAVVIRTWHDYSYTPEDLIYLRSIISELTLHSGGEYTVLFLIHVKNSDTAIFSDDETYERVLRESLPEEFRGMGVLWNERQMELMYGGLEETRMRDLLVHGVYRSTFMPMQYLAYTHPEFDYFWHWEMDIRTTNHWYHLFTSVVAWAKKQPRKLLWERNSRFYVPAKHGSWEDFSHMVRIQTEQGTNSPNNMWSGLNQGNRMPGSDSSSKQTGDRPIWGPELPLDDPKTAFDTDPKPPHSFEKDKYTWGVDEEADLITFNPLFDPDATTWLLADDTSGYNKTRGQPPRRTAIITASRLSRRLLMTMHKETALNHHTMFSEMWPASCALHHA
ncbi:uncharacterized protein AB675_11884 [Cyphellophora attinorum]|uniref:Uncharacterized protein n=1 Tax=Cyphellophora attinorum TaxID=1664694 RepID=A0A0N1NWY2_9EURO|nr:uncharacterized protein AB675_11884 [Phialophora attinorum]KPI36767.1 hypothetical protein AB675_11884 [Phialophora attinorum]